MARSKIVRWFAGVFFVLMIVVPTGIYGWRYLLNPCEIANVENGITKLTTQMKVYDHLYQVATTASPSTLERPVLEMQQVQMDTQELEVPVCLRKAKNVLINYMYTVIGALRAWQAGASDSTVLGMITQSDAYYINFKTEIDQINKCAPYCLP